MKLFGLILIGSLTLILNGCNGTDANTKSGKQDSIDNLSCSSKHFKPPILEAGSDELEIHLRVISEYVIEEFLPYFSEFYIYEHLRSEDSFSAKTISVVFILEGRDNSSDTLFNTYNSGEAKRVDFKYSSNPDYYDLMKYVNCNVRDSSLIDLKVMVEILKDEYNRVRGDDEPRDFISLLYGYAMEHKANQAGDWYRRYMTTGLWVFAAALYPKASESLSHIEYLLDYYDYQIPDSVRSGVRNPKLQQRER